MRRTIRRHALTFGALVVLALSLCVMAVGPIGVLQAGNAWRVLIVPGYVTMLISAILATALSIPNNVLLWLASIALTVLPFAVLDWLRARFHRAEGAAT